MDIVEAREKIEKGIEDLEKGNYVTGTAQELYAQAVKRARERIKAKIKEKNLERDSNLQ